MALTKIEIDSYKVERGTYYVVEDARPDYSSWHRLFLEGKPDSDGNRMRIEMIFAGETYLENYLARGLGIIWLARNYIRVRNRIDEFDATYELLRSEKPVFFEYDQLESAELPPERRRIHTVRITTNKEDTGEGPSDPNAGLTPKFHGIKAYLPDRTSLFEVGLVI